MAKTNGISIEKKENEKSMNLEVPSMLSMVREPRNKLVRTKNTLSLLERDIGKQDT